MSRRLVVPVVALALATAVLPAVAAGPAPARVAERSATLVRGDLGPATGDWAARAVALLGADAAELRTTVRHSVLGVHVRGVQVRDGVRVDGTASLVTAVDGRVVQVEVHRSDLPGRPVGAPVPPAVAVRAATQGLDLLVPAHVERVLVPVDGVLRDTWRVSVVSARPALARRVDVDAATGTVRTARDVRRFVDGTAKVFDPNPVVTKRDAKLRQPLETGQSADVDAPSAELDAQRRTLRLEDLDAGALQQGRLVGPYVNVLSGGYVVTDPEKPVFDVGRHDPRFEGLMAYAHLDRFQRYLQSLGFRGRAAVNAEQQEIVAVPPPGFDNSFYQPGNDLMLLGGGGVDDGEDADVILHEYGHAMHDAQVPGWGDTNEGGAMGEGFGDFVAAAYYARRTSFNATCVADWDATTYSDDDPPCLRRTDSKKHYPEDVEEQVHADGEIWSAFLWRLRASLGRTEAERSDNAIRLVVASHELLTPQAEFADAVRALRTAARALGRPQWVPLVDRAAKVNGLA